MSGCWPQRPFSLAACYWPPAPNPCWSAPLTPGGVGSRRDKHQYGTLSDLISHSRKISSASGNGRRVIGRLRAAGAFGISS